MTVKSNDTTQKNNTSNPDSLEHYIHHLGRIYDTVMDVEEILNSDILEDESLIKQLPLAVNRTKILKVTLKSLKLTIGLLVSHTKAGEQ